MELKDYLTLFIPIIVNGIFIFIAQKMISTKLEKKNREQKLSNSVVETLYKKVQDVYYEYLVMRNHYLNESVILDYSKIENLDNLILDLDCFFVVNWVDLHEFDDERYSLMRYWDEILDFLNSHSDSTIDSDRFKLIFNDMKAPLNVLLTHIRLHY